MCDLSDTPTRSATGQFLPGRSGNPAGRPLGARNKASRLAEMIDAADSEAIIRIVVERALAGDWPALRICFTRLVAPKKEAPVAFDLPAVATLADVAEASSALLAAVAAGEITPGEGQKVMALLSAQIRILTAADRAREAPARAIAAAPSPSASAPLDSAAVGEAAARPAPLLSEGEGRAVESCISPVSNVVEEPFLSEIEARPERSRRDDRAIRRCAGGTVQPDHAGPGPTVPVSSSRLRASDVAGTIPSAPPPLPSSWPFGGACGGAQDGSRDPSWPRVDPGLVPPAESGSVACISPVFRGPRRTGATFPPPFGLSLSKPVLSTAAGGVEGAAPPSLSIRRSEGLRRARPERVPG